MDGCADFPLFLDYTDEEYAAVEEYAAEKVAQALLTEASSPATRPSTPSRKKAWRPWPSAPRVGKGPEGRVPFAREGHDP